MNISNMEQFGQSMTDAIGRLLPQNQIVKMNTVLKNNGYRAVGICIFEEDHNIAPTLYLDSFYHRYQEGEELSQLAQEFLEEYKRYQINEKIDISFFTDYQKVKGRIVFKLINRKLNQELLTQIPHRSFMDLEIVYYCLMEHDTMGNATILIHKSHMEQWNVREEDLWKIARQNTPKRLRGEICDMKKIIEEITSIRFGSEVWEEMQEITMYVMTNKKRFLGAAVLLYDHVVRQFAYTIGKNLYIIPSSVHELILVPDDGKIDVDNLNQMVREVNREQLDEREVLADHVYYYDYEDDILSACI